MNYTAYGYTQNNTNIGLNGDYKINNLYLMGNGYRLYSPKLRRFYSLDSMSPSNKAGINPYTFVNGDPINYSDPTGHMPKINLLGRGNFTNAPKHKNSISFQEARSIAKETQTNIKHRELYRKYLELVTEFNENNKDNSRITWSPYFSSTTFANSIIDSPSIGQWIYTKKNYTEMTYVLHGDEELQSSDEILDILELNNVNRINIIACNPQKWLPNFLQSFKNRKFDNKTSLYVAQTTSEYGEEMAKVNPKATANAIISNNPRMVLPITQYQLISKPKSWIQKLLGT